MDASDKPKLKVVWTKKHLFSQKCILRLQLSAMEYSRVQVTENINEIENDQGSIYVFMIGSQFFLKHLIFTP